MTKAETKPRKPRAKKSEPIMAQLMKTVEVLTQTVSEQGALIEDLRARFNLSLEQTRNETGASREAGRMQDRVNKGFTDAVFGDGKPGVIADTQTNTTSISVMQTDIKNLQKPLDDIRKAAISAVIGLVVSIFLLGLNLALGAGIFAPR